MLSNIQSLEPAGALAPEGPITRPHHVNGNSTFHPDHKANATQDDDDSLERQETTASVNRQNQYGCLPEVKEAHEVTSSRRLSLVS